MGNPLTLPPLLLTKMLSLDAIAIIYTKRKLFQAVSTPLSRHLPPFAPVYGQPPDPTSTFIDKNVITGCCCNNTYREKVIPECFYPIFLPSPASCLKIQFLTIYPHLRQLMGNPLTPPSLLLTKMLPVDAIAIIYTERKLFQALSTPLSRHLLPFACKFHFWPFTPICACL